MDGETVSGDGPPSSTRRKTTRTMDSTRSRACLVSSADPYRRSSCLAVMADEGRMGGE